MLFKLAILLFALLLPCDLMAACGGSSPNWVTDGNDESDIQECHDEASCVDGDTITVSGGATATWTSQLAITKKVKIVGPGASNLTVTCGYGVYAGGPTYQISYVPANPGTTHTFELSGFTFDSSNLYIVLGASNQTLTFDKISIHNNVFNNGPSQANGGFVLYFKGSFNGVVYSNTFNTSGRVINTGGIGGGKTNWESQTYRTGTLSDIEDDLYFEDNIGNGITYLVFEGGQGGRYVSRYNTWNFTDETSMTGAHDMHGNQPSNVWSGMGGAVYGNYITQTIASTRIAHHRGGRGLVFYNYTDTDKTPYISLKEEYIDTYNGEPYTASDGETQYINGHYWNNRKGSSGAYVEGAFDDADDNCAEPCVQVTENTHYWNSDDVNCAAGGAACSAGIGCGTFENRPDDCTTGTAYWATSQGNCTNMVGYVGDSSMRTSSSTYISGTLYKCTSTNTWTSYYTPYTYPHPLRGTTPPSATGCTMSGAQFR